MRISIPHNDTDDEKINDLQKKYAMDLLDSLDKALEKGKSIGSESYLDFIKKMILLNAELKKVFTVNPLKTTQHRITSTEKVKDVHMKCVMDSISSTTLSEQEAEHLSDILRHCIAFEKIYLKKHEDQVAGRLGFFDKKVFETIQKAPLKMSFQDISRLVLPLKEAVYISLKNYNASKVMSNSRETGMQTDPEKSSSWGVSSFFWASTSEKNTESQIASKEKKVSDASTQGGYGLYSLLSWTTGFFSSQPTPPLIKEKIEKDVESTLT